METQLMLRARSAEWLRWVFFAAVTLTAVAGSMGQLA
jgi:hypothetical protein